MEEGPRSTARRVAARATQGRGPHRALAPIARRALEAALEAVPAPALVLGPGGRVCHANALARALLSSAPASMTARLDGLGDGSAPPPDIAVTHLEHPGHRLVVLRSESLDADARASAAAVRWGLSDRHRQVLALLADGTSNQAIAAKLGCATATVERHVSAILDRAGARSRAELVARVWTGT